MLKLYLIRHAESLGNKKGIHMGSDVDLELSEKGKEQAVNLAKFFKNKKINAIYSSDLKRAFGTAETLGESLNVPIKKDKNLRELKIGSWAGRKDVSEKWNSYYSEQRFKGISRKKIRPPGGENSWDHQKRVQIFLDSIKNQKGNIIVVAHAGTNKVFLGTIEGKDPDDFYAIKQDNACINELEYDGKIWKILRTNFTDY